MRARESLFINRELTWLEFNQRVLGEACDAAVPLLERLRFLSISASNLDEFFMVRVGGLELLLEAESTRTDPAGLTAGEQLEGIAERVRKMVAEQYSCYHEQLENELARSGIRRVRMHELTGGQAEYVERFFNEEMFPVVTPMAVDLAREFPLLINLGLNLIARLKPRGKDRSNRFAVIPLGPSIDRFVTLPSEGGYVYMLVEDVIQAYVAHLFPGEAVLECVPFRITRNADLNVQEDFAADFLSEMKEVVDKRKHSGCVRLGIDRAATRTLLKFLQGRLKVRWANVFEIPSPLDLAAFSVLSSLEGFKELTYKPWPPQASPTLDPRQSVFEELSGKDVMLFHPYESFEPVLRLVREAADDPDVLAIKQTLYRTSPNSPVIDALRRAAENGKTVSVIVELKARFDEARNIEWAEKLERAGVQVIYGVKGLKTHSKLCVVVRRQPEGIVRYVHFGTGNYNEKTARMYSDVSTMTCNPDLGRDASAFFNCVCGYSEPQRFLKLEMAPIGLRERLIELIDGEISRKKQGQKAMIMAKMNSLSDPDVIQALYRASNAGVKVLLNVRGICCLRPGIRNQSENIKVVSIVDRYLEHSRLLYFHHGGEASMFISSADWMTRNLSRRVELLVPIDDPACRKRLLHVLETYFKDNQKSYELLPDGSYRRTRRRGRSVRSQEAIYQWVCDAVKEAQRSGRTVFEPHRPTSR